MILNVIKNLKIMKKQTLLFLLILFINNIFSQELPLKVDVLEGQYVELDSTATVIMKDTIPFGGLNFTLNQPINLFGESLDSFYFIENEVQFIAGGNKKNEELDVFCPIFLPFENTDNDSLPYSISYKISGEVGKRILTIQWKNFFAEEQIEFDFVNYQIRMDEANQTLDYIYGPSSGRIDAILALEDIPVLIGIFDDLASTDEDEVDVYYIGSSLVNPRLKYQKDIDDIDEIKGPFPKYPRTNMVIRFSKNSVATKELSLNKIRLKKNLIADKLEIETDEEISKISIINSSGITMLSDKSRSGNFEYDVFHYTKGIYFIRMELTDGSFQTMKFAKM